MITTISLIVAGMFVEHFLGIAGLIMQYICSKITKN